MTHASPADYSTVQSLPQMWAIAAQRFASIPALSDPRTGISVAYRVLYQQMQQFAAGIQALGIAAQSEDPDPPRIALYSDNNIRWPVADQGIMAAGAVNVVRGSQADPDELLFILRDSGAIALVVEDHTLLKKIQTRLPDAVQWVVLLSDETVAPAAEGERPLLNFTEVMALGEGKSIPPAPQTRDTLATLMYTSGTSGTPKGVMLTHGNLLSQVEGLTAVVQPQPGDRVLSILPIWHCYERTFEYLTFAQGCTQFYTNIRYVKKDIKAVKPHYMVGVPRLWESIYEGIQKQFRDQPAKKQALVNTLLNASLTYIKARRTVQGLDLENLHPSIGEKVAASLKLALFAPIHQLADKLIYAQVRAGTGGAIQYLVSGGGSIAEYLEDFFEIVGIQVLGGYGLTETAPITNVRRPDRNLRGADGQPYPGTEVRIVDLETRQPLPPGQQGLVMIRGPQVMKGYFHNPQATAKALSPEGWFDTGDLGLITDHEDLIITGRAKDTIVLTNGENIEPQPIEDACLRSPYIDQIMLVGQDQRSIGALIVPNLEALQLWAASQSLYLRLPEDETPTPSGLQAVDLGHKTVQDLFRQELLREVQNRPGYRPDDRITVYRLILEPFSVENGLLTQTLKIRRPVVTERYRGMIDEMFS